MTSFTLLVIELLLIWALYESYQEKKELEEESRDLRYENEELKLEKFHYKKELKDIEDIVYMNNYGDSKDASEFKIRKVKEIMKQNKKTLDSDHESKI